MPSELTVRGTFEEQETRLLDEFSIRVPLPMDALQSGKMIFPRQTLAARGTRTAISLRNKERDCPVLAGFIKSLESATTKFEYGKFTRKQWKQYYGFPDARTIRRHHTLSIPGADVVLNESAAVVRKWLQELLASLQPAHRSDSQPKKVIIIRGAIGCGKSTFLKYICNYHAAAFQRAKVIPSRIEHSKMKTEIARGLAGKEITGRLIAEHAPLYVLRQIFRDCIRYICCHEPVTREPRAKANILQSESFLRFCVDQIKNAAIEKLHVNEWAKMLSQLIRGGANDEAAASSPYARAFLNRIAEYLAADWRGKRLMITEFTRIEIEIVLKYAQNHGYVFLPIFDGFDYISAGDFLFNTEAVRLLDWLADTFFSGQGQLYFELLNGWLQISGIVSLRDNTLSYFLQNNWKMYGFYSIDYSYRIISPSWSDITKNAVARVLKESSCSEDDIDRWVQNFIKIERRTLAHLRKGVGIERALHGRHVNPESSARGLGALFNYNIRFMLDFLRAVVVEICDVALQPLGALTKATNLHNFLALLDGAFPDLVRTRSYRLVEMALLSDNHVFRNLFSVDWHQLSAQLNSRRKKSLNACFRVNQSQGGYVDNIFNYHVKDTREMDLRYALMEKIWILSVLSRAERGMTTQQLVDTFHDRLEYTAKALSASLAILICAGFVKADFTNSGDIEFSIESLGYIVLGSFCCRLEYLEHVFFHTYMPDWLLENSVDAVRYPVGDHRHWSLAAIVNSFIMIQYIWNLEDAALRDTGAEEYFVCERIRKTLKRTLSRMIRADHRVAPSKTWLVSDALVAIGKIKVGWVASLRRPTVTGLRSMTPSPAG
jgi:hypothetical protein